MVAWTCKAQETPTKNMINNHHQRRPMPQIMLSHAKDCSYDALNHNLSFSLSFTLPPALVLSLFVSYSRISNRIMSHATLASKSFLTYLPAPLPVPHSSVAQFVIPLCHWLSLSVSPSLYLFLTQRVLILLEFSLDYVHMDSKTAAAMCLCLVPTCCSSLVFLGYNRLLI